MMLKKALISGFLLASIFLVGCKENQNVQEVQVELAEVTEIEKEVEVTVENGRNDEIPNILPQLQNDISEAITEQLTEIEKEVEVTVENGRNDGIPNILPQLQNEISEAITELTAIDMDLIAITLSSGGTVVGNFEVSCSVGFPKDLKIDNMAIQQIVEDTIKNIYERENVTISEENITIKIEKY